MLSITRPLPSMLILMLFDLRILMKSVQVNCDPWPVLKYSGFSRSSASVNASQQKSGSRVVEIRQETI
jgi:hypothetical protein